MDKWKKAKEQYRDFQVLERFHRNTSHTVSGFSYNAIRPVVIPQEQEEEGIALDEGEAGKLFLTLEEALKKRRTGWQFDKDMNKAQMEAILTSSFGVTQVKQFQGFWVSLRAYASAGAMYSVEPYVYVNHVSEELDGRIWRYNPKNNKLHEVQTATVEQINDLTSITRYHIKNFYQAKMVVFFVADLNYIFKKYGMLAYRLVLLEAGHMCENLQLVACAMDYQAVPLGGFYELEVNKLLKLKKKSYCMYMAAIG